MVEQNGILLHLDLKEDRTARSGIEFDGWVAADRPIAAVWLPDAGSARLTTCDRPDVRRVFPSRQAIGFTGRCRAQNIRGDSLRFAVQIDQTTHEFDHPLPPALPCLSTANRILLAVRLAWLRFRFYLTRSETNRWQLSLRRHLILREQRSGIFRRRHADALLANFAAALPDARFIQIGANDGFTGDPIHHLIVRPDTHWRGILVEPVPSLFADLRSRYGSNPHLQFEQAAITDRDGTTRVHRLSTAPGDSLWLQQIPSLDPNLLCKNAAQFGAASSEIVSEDVPSLTISTLLARHKIERLDLLVIDTEGWDWRVLQQFDLARWQPKLILFEHQHLSADERAQAHHFLRGNVYDWAEMEEGDTLAWRAL